MNDKSSEKLVMKATEVLENEQNELSKEFYHTAKYFQIRCIHVQKVYKARIKLI